MTEEAVTHRAGAAINHLHASAAAFSPGDYVSEASALTGDDLNGILDRLEKVHAAAVAEQKP